MAMDADREGLLAVSRSLRVHGFVQDAFTTLQQHGDDLGQDTLFLSAFCEAGVLARSALRLDPRYGSAQQNLALAWRAGAPGRLEAIVAHCLGRGRPAAAAEEEEELAATSSQDCEVVEALARAGRLSVRGLQQQQPPRA